MFSRSWQKKQKLFSQKLMDTVTDKIESKRNKGICSLVKYLENPDSYKQVAESLLSSYPKKRELAKVTKNVFHDFFPVISLTRVLKILKTASLKSPLQKKSKTEDLNDICASQKINIWVVLKKTY